MLHSLFTTKDKFVFPHWEKDPDIVFYSKFGLQESSDRCPSPVGEWALFPLWTCATSNIPPPTPSATNIPSKRAKCTIIKSKNQIIKQGLRRQIQQQAVWWFMPWRHPHSYQGHSNHQSPNSKTPRGHRIPHKPRNPKTHREQKVPKDTWLLPAVCTFTHRSFSANVPSRSRSLVFEARMITSSVKNGKILILVVDTLHVFAVLCSSWTVERAVVAEEKRLTHYCHAN